MAKRTKDYVERALLTYKNYVGRQDANLNQIINSPSSFDDKTLLSLPMTLPFLTRQNLLNNIPAFYQQNATSFVILKQGCSNQYDVIGEDFENTNSTIVGLGTRREIVCYSLDTIYSSGLDPEQYSVRTLLYLQNDVPTVEGETQRERQDRITRLSRTIYSKDMGIALNFLLRQQITNLCEEASFYKELLKNPETILNELRKTTYKQLTDNATSELEARLDAIKYDLGIIGKIIIAIEDVSSGLTVDVSIKNQFEDLNDKESAIRALYSIFELGMRQRQWLGPTHPYPYSGSDARGREREYNLRRARGEEQCVTLSFEDWNASNNLFPYIQELLNLLGVPGLPPIGMSKQEIYNWLSERLNETGRFVFNLPAFNIATGQPNINAPKLSTASFPFILLIPPLVVLLI